MKSKLHNIIGDIARAAKQAGRDPATIDLVAVSKFHPAEAVRELLAEGHRIFGENRVQEATAKFLPLRAEYPDLELHLLGPLQSNKADQAVKLFDVIQTLDRPSLAEALAAAIKKQGRTPRLYVEVNIGLEHQKAGMVPTDLSGFLVFCREQCGLSVQGLMCIPPQAEAPELFFRHLKQLADQHHLPHLSMGMSADFETAIACGATEVRVGTAIFGART